MKVKSSLINEINYRPKTETLSVTFTNGDVWDYNGVDNTIWEMFRIANSTGKFYLENIKGKYTGTKVE